MEKKSNQSQNSKLDDIIFLAKKDCKKCHGRGYTGFRVLEQHLEPCKCLKTVKNDANLFTLLGKDEFLKYKTLTHQEVKNELIKWQGFTSDKGRGKKGGNPVG